MDLTKGCGELESIGIARYHLFDDIGAEPLVVEFLCQADCSDVLQAKPHLVANIVLRCITLVNIIESSHVVCCID